MKKITTLVTAIVMLFSATAFATTSEENVPAKVKAAFEKNFAAAAEVTWEKTNEGYSAFFKLNDLSVKAVYDEGGRLVSASRTISFNQLPLGVSLSISKKYKDFTIAETAMEMNVDGQTEYYVIVQNSKEVLRLKCGCSGSIQEEKLN